MTLQDAEKILNIDPFFEKIDQVSESNNYFIFNVVPLDTTSDRDKLIIPASAVHKKTGKVITFNPITMSRSEKASIRRIR